MRVALATCAEFPGGDEDADLVVAAFRRARVETSWQVWDDPDVAWDAFDTTVLRSTWDYTDRREDFLAWADRVPHLLNPVEVVRWSSDKTYLRDLAAAGVPTVATAFVAPGQPLALAAAGDVVVKPSVGAGSRGAGRFRLPEQDTAARAHAAALHAEGRTVLVQEYVVGVDTAGETAVVCLGGEPWHAANKAALLPPGTAHPLHLVARAGEHGLYLQEVMSRTTATAAELDVAARALAHVTERFGHAPPYARVDLLPGAAGPVMVEVELVEPSLFLGHAPDPAAAADRLVAGVLAAVPA